MENLYAVWIKIDEPLPWIELKGTYRTKREAKKAADRFLSSIKIRIVEMPEKRRRMKALVPVKHARN
ncbi:MAG: hypothetical protein QMD13_01065 [Candidatus Bathyarchaeia archaeon]|nr:hypothetical protein [Candidatus Bathyarchaeia archaeon]MDI6904073.1 hypothetical protein [Candidatus Bathyarchaeia archaeon]